MVFELAEVAFDTIPIELNTEAPQPIHVRRPLRPECGAGCFADDLARDPLTDMALAAAIGQERRARPATGVDESRRDCFSHRVDDLTGAAVGQVPNRGDSIALDADVGLL